MAWDWITPENLITLQRRAALDHMGEQARLMLKQGYPAEADRILDEMLERQRRWEEHG